MSPPPPGPFWAPSLGRRMVAPGWGGLSRNATAGPVTGHCQSGWGANVRPCWGAAGRSAACGGGRYRGARPPSARPHISTRTAAPLHAGTGALLRLDIDVEDPDAELTRIGASRLERLVDVKHEV